MGIGFLFGRGPLQGRKAKPFFDIGLEAKREDLSEIEGTFGIHYL